MAEVLEGILEEEKNAAEILTNISDPVNTAAETRPAYSIAV